ncbi:MAG TPA: hypothetical protein DCF44_12510 [Chitinophagaceae bacterium]|nr:hypothetical protein [Chitinophagaceae bacterium]
MERSKVLIKNELLNALVIFGAQSDLLCIVGSWGDTMNDDVVLEQLRGWNEGALKEKERERRELLEFCNTNQTSPP